MYKSDNKVGLIEQYKQELKSIQNHSFTNSNNIGYWNRLTDYISKFSTDQLNYIDSNKEVVKAHSDMLQAFLLYMFDKHKDEFVALDNFRPICDTYINSVIQAGEQYTKENDNLRQRLKEYEKRIAELEGNNGRKTK